MSKKLLQWKNEVWPIDKVWPWEGNPRTFTDKGMADLKNSVDKFGVIDQIAINTDGMIIGGHARYKDYRERGMTEVEVRVPERTLTMKECQEANIRLNANIAGTWNLEMLESWDKEELSDWGLELDWPEPELEAEEDNYQPPAKIETDIVRGDIIEIGSHRLLCGDSTNADDVAKLLNGNEPYLMITDPPYGVEYDPEWRSDAGVNKNKRKMGKVTNDDKCDWGEAWGLSPAKVAYVWHADRHASEVQNSIEESGYETRSQIIWAKDRFALSRGNYHWQHEPCWYAVKKGSNANWAGDRSQSTLWNINSRDDSGVGHSTQKPIECMAKPIGNHEGDVYDPFLGSGTTMVACEQLNRTCYGMEISETYCQIIIDRMIKAFPDIVVKINGELYKEAIEA